MSLITPPTPIRERKAVRYLRDGKGFRHPAILAALAFLVVAWIAGTLLGAEDGKAAPADGVALVPSTAAPATSMAPPATSTPVDVVQPPGDCPELPVPADATYHLSGRFGQNLHYLVVEPDEYGNTLEVGVTLFEGGPVYRDDWCAEHALMSGPASDKIEALQVCEAKPFPSGMHLDYERTSNADIQMIHVRANAKEDWAARLPYGHVIDGDQTVYTDFWCAELAASM